MIEITYADMFLFVVILFLLALWIKARLDVNATSDNGGTIRFV